MEKIKTEMAEMDALMKYARVIPFITRDMDAIKKRLQAVINSIDDDVYSMNLEQALELIGEARFNACEAFERIGDKIREKCN